MKTPTNDAQKAQSISNLALDPWRTVVVQPATPGGQFLMRRHRVYPAVADLIASLAGIGEGHL